LAVSPDKRTILYTQWDATDSDIILVEFLWRISDKHSGKCPSLTTNRVRGDHWRCPRKNRTSGPDGIWRLAHGAATASAHPSVVNYHGMPVSREEPRLYRTRVGAISFGSKIGSN
jgi:hypothetical protein